MPVVGTTQTSLVRKANTALAGAFFPRFARLKWPQICGSTLSTSLVEPFALNGASPIMRAYNGNLQSAGVSSWKMSVPNLLFKNFEEISRTAIEGDQTGTILKRIAMIGGRVADSPDYLFAKRILTGHLNSSTSVVFEGVTYYTTFETTAATAVPFFSSTHTSSPTGVLPAGQTYQSNLLQGQLPNTASGVLGQDVAVSANEMQEDLQNAFDTISGWVDDKGAMLFPALDPENQITVVVPPILQTVANLALKIRGVIGGKNGSSTGSTSSVGPTLVKNVMTFPLLKQVQDIEAASYSMITNSDQTAYYIFIEDEYAKPFYFQRFRPPKGSEYWPAGYDPDKLASEIMAKSREMGFAVTPEAADVYAMTEVDHNFGALGAQAQESVVKGEKFFMSGRTRMNFIYGPWFTAIKVIPQNGNSGT